MIGHKNLLTACFAALLALGLAACGTTGDDAPTAAMMDDDDTQMDDDAMPGELEAAQMAATDAAMAADGFATAADTDATNAADAAMGRARFQTTPSSQAHAVDAREHAAYARTAADDAQTAADKAAAATTITDAVLAQGVAERARDDAKIHRGHVMGFHRDAVAAAAMEVVVGEDGYRVGDTTIMADGRTLSQIVGGKAVDTGLIDSMAVDTPGMRTMNGLLVVGEDGEPVAGLVAADVDIGVTHDSGGDSARLTLVRSFLGTRKQMQFVRDDDDGNPFDNVDAPPSNGQNLSPNTEDDDIINGAVTVPNGAGANILDVVEVPRVAGGDFRAFDAPMTGVTLYYVRSGVEDVTTDDDIDQTKIYLERDRTTEGGTVTVTYNVVNVIEVTLDNATPFKHLNYGLWNGLSGAADNTIADLGVGFVNALTTGEGMTQDMPNFGGATYTGNWVANIRAGDVDGDGAISRHSGTSTIDATFGGIKPSVTIILMELATLTGDITENTFEGTKMMGVGTIGGLDGADAAYTGDFRGGFFGSLAEEAGGVFTYTSTDKENGEFTGAFGGDR